MTGGKGRYFIKDFTEANYRRLVTLAASRFFFADYMDVRALDQFVLWRHDIDLSVHRALALARIDAEQGVRATCFVQLGSPFYNVFEPEIRRLLREIFRLGHRAGLHFDPESWGVRDRGDLERRLRFERRTLESLLEVPVNTFSFHNPSPERTADFDAFRYGGMVNAYAAFFRCGVGYCSDSNGYWRHKRLEDVLRSGDCPRLQVLTHPEWWTKKAMVPRERVMRCIKGRELSCRRGYDAFLGRQGRVNVR